MLDAIDAIVGRGPVGRLYGVERDVDRIVAVGVDLHRQTEGLHLGHHLFELAASKFGEPLEVELRYGFVCAPVSVWFDPSPTILTP